MMEEISVRIGTLDDLDNMMNLAMMACEENGFLDPNPQKLLVDIYPALCLQDGIVGIIGEIGKMPESAVLLRVGSMWYSDKKIVEEKAIFTHPDFRDAKGGRARRMCEFSKRVADNLGLPLIIGILSNHRTEGKVRMYRRIFGEPTGAFFLYGAKTGQWKDAAE